MLELHHSKILTSNTIQQLIYTSMPTLTNPAKPSSPFIPDLNTSKKHQHILWYKSVEYKLIEVATNQSCKAKLGCCLELTLEEFELGGPSCWKPIFKSGLAEFNKCLWLITLLLILLLL